MPYVSYIIYEETGFYPNSDLTEQHILDGWRRHGGGDCPVHPDTMIAVPAGTYYCDDPDRCFYMKARDMQWNDKDYFHLRDHIQTYQIMKTANQPEEGMVMVTWSLKPDKPHKHINVFNKFLNYIKSGRRK